MPIFYPSLVTSRLQRPLEIAIGKRSVVVVEDKFFKGVKGYISYSSTNYSLLTAHCSKVFSFTLSVLRFFSYLCRLEAKKL